MAIYCYCKSHWMQVVKLGSKLRHKFTLIAFPGVFSMWTISLNAPTIVSQHMFIPSTLIPCLYDLQILVESFTLLITDCTKVFREVIQMAMQKMQLDAHVATQRFVGLQEFMDNFDVIRCS